MKTTHRICIWGGGGSFDILIQASSTGSGILGPLNYVVNNLLEDINL